MPVLEIIKVCWLRKLEVRCGRSGHIDRPGPTGWIDDVKGKDFSEVTVDDKGSRRTATNHDIGPACGRNGIKVNGTGIIIDINTIFGQEIHLADATGRHS